jgi:hypothetical protein
LNNKAVVNLQVNTVGYCFIIDLDMNGIGS